MILAFDTATDWLTVAVGDPENVRAELNEPAPRAHLNRLLPAIDALLTEAGTDREKINYLAVGIGPGSFTGVRIAVATAQGLSHSLGRPLIGVSTLDIIAAGLIDKENVIYPVLDAKRKEVYAAGYGSDGRRFTDYRVINPEDLAREIRSLGKPVVMAGDGLAKYPEIFSDQTGPAASSAESRLWQPNAAVLIRLAGEKISKEPVGPYFQVLPIYVRLPDAKEKQKREKPS